MLVHVYHINNVSVVGHFSLITYECCLKSNKIFTFINLQNNTDVLSRYGCNGNTHVHHVDAMYPIRKKTAELPTSLPMGCTWATEWSARGLPMGILPCKLGCPLLPYIETVDSSVGSPLLPNIKKWAVQWAAEWAAHGNFCHAN